MLYSSNMVPGTECSCAVTPCCRRSYVPVSSGSINRSILGMIRYADGQTNPAHKQEASDHNHKAAHAMVGLATHKVRLDALPCMSLGAKSCHSSLVVCSGCNLQWAGADTDGMGMPRDYYYIAAQLWACTTFSVPPAVFVTA